MLSFSQLFDALTTTFGTERILGAETQTRDPFVLVAGESIAAVAEFLRDQPEMAFDSLNDLCAVDWLAMPVRKGVTVEPRVEVVYQLFSYRHRHRLTLKVQLPRWKDDEQKTLPELPSVSHIWSIANWHEREAYDLGGVRFLNHPDLKRILCAEDWEGHPLRKDYEFPLEYHGIRGR